MGDQDCRYLVFLAADPHDPREAWEYIEARQAYEIALDEGVREFLEKDPDPEIGLVQLWYWPNANGDLVVAWRVGYTSMRQRADVDVTIDAVTGEVLKVSLREHAP